MDHENKKKLKRHPNEHNKRQANDEENDSKKKNIEMFARVNNDNEMKRANENECETIVCLLFTEF